MRPTCTAGGCVKPVAGNPSFGRYCGAHRQRRRRHGDAEQRTLTQRDFHGIEKALKGRVARQHGLRLWALLDDRWTALVALASDIVEAAKRGPYNRHEKRAAEEVLRIATSADGRLVWQRVAALHMLQEKHPRTFASDRAFRFELVRLVRQLSDMNRGSYWNNSTGRVHRVYSDVPPKAVEVIAEWLIAAFGVVGLRLAREEDAAAARQARERTEFHEALREAAADA